MEHEDNTQFDNFLQNAQHCHMDTMQIVGGNDGCGVGIGVGVDVLGGGDNVANENYVAGFGGGISANLGGKFEEQDDDEEWKYIKEGQQSEKDLLKDHENNGNGNGNGNANDNGHGVHHHFDDQFVGDGADMGLGNGFNSGKHHLYQQDSADDDFYGHENMPGFGAGGNGHSLDEEVEIIKNDGDFSTTSNTTSTAGEDDLLMPQSADNNKILADDFNRHFVSVETRKSNEQLHLADDREEEEENDMNSLATTTNGTSSLSENAAGLMPQQAEIQMDDSSVQQQQEIEDDFNREEFINNQNNQHRYNLNPNAQEFVPSFGSNATTPTSPMPNSDIDFLNPKPATASSHDFEENLQEQILEPQQMDGNSLDDLVNHSSPISSSDRPDFEEPLSAVPRHLAGDDDFVALSPRKGRVADMEGIFVPQVEEFENEAAKRPHELEKEDDIPLEHLEMTENSKSSMNNEEMIIAGNSSLSQHNILLNDSFVNENQDCLDFPKTSSPNNFMDHGPETCVDLDHDSLSAQVPPSADIAKPDSLFNENPIEDVLNSVQPLPTEDEEEPDNTDNDAISEQIKHEMDLANKELFNVEEKEHLSQSPSTEEFEMNMNMKNTQFNEQLLDFAPPQAHEQAESHQHQFQFEQENLEQHQHQEEEHYNPQTNTQTECLAHDNSAQVTEDSHFNMQNQLPLDMKESFYMENTSSDNNFNPDDDQQFLNNQFEAKTDNYHFEHEPEHENVTPTEEKHLDMDFEENNEKSEDQISINEEKHLLEDTKECVSSYLAEEIESHSNASLNAAAANAVSAESFQNLESQFENLNLESNDSINPDQGKEFVFNHDDDVPIDTAQPEDFGFQMQQDEQHKTFEQNQEDFDRHDEKNDDEQHEEEEVKEKEEAEKILKPVDEEEIVRTEAMPVTSSFLEEPIAESTAAPTVEPIADLTAEPIAESTAMQLAESHVEPHIDVDTSKVEVEPEMASPAVEAFEELKPQVVEENQTATAAGAVAAVAATAVTAAAAAATAVHLAKDAKKPAAAEAKKAPASKAAPSKTKSTGSAGASAGAKKPAAEPVKKASETVKKVAAKPSSSSLAAAKPKPATTAAAAGKSTTAGAVEKKPLGSSVSKTTTTAAKPKPLASATKTTSATTAAKTPARPATAPAAAKPAAAKPPVAARTTASASTTARKPLATSSAAAPAAKPRPASGTAAAAAKPSTLNVPGSGTGAARPKTLSPKAPTATTTTARKVTSSIGAARSPTKTSATSAANTTLASRTTKSSGGPATTSSSSTTTTVHKSFTARPAPKYNHSSTTTTTTASRKTTGSATTTTTTTTVTSASSNLKPGVAGSTLRKSSPNKSLISKTSAASPAGKATTPSKTLAAAKNKTKDAANLNSSSTKSPIIKSKQKEAPAAPLTNGVSKIDDVKPNEATAAAVNGETQQNGSIEQKPVENGFPVDEEDQVQAPTQPQPPSDAPLIGV